MKKLTLTGKLVIAGVAIVLISVLSIGLLASVKTSRELESLAKNDVNKTARSTADLVQLSLTQEMRLAREVALDQDAVEAASVVASEGAEKAAPQIEALQRKLSGIQSNIGENYETIVTFDLNGIVFADSQAGRDKGINAADREYFKIAKQGKYNVGSVVKSKATGQPIAPLAVPILTDKKEVIGVLAIMLKTDYLVEKILGVKVGKTGYAYMVDQNGIVIAHRDRELILKNDIKTNEGMEAVTKAILAGESGVQYYAFRREKKVAGYDPVEMTRWSVVATESLGDLMAPIRALQKQMALMAVILLTVIIGAVILLGKHVSKPILRAVKGLFGASAQVASAAEQVSTASQQLAEGASQQAASVEETSSSLEEMSSMTKQNAQNANLADRLMAGTAEMVGQANDSMASLTASMEEISRASEETQKIIRTIDEIAFQTNLLALNAAVEAARAGEAGAGFAVVADEVRNLAIRAADAAKSTAALIEGNARQIQAGRDIVGRTNEAFRAVEENARKVGGLLGEIASASGEQAQGIEQINKAVSEMDKVIQQNAAGAEESASASEEMTGQAEQMKKFVRDLVALVGGDEGSSTGVPSGPEMRARRAHPVPRSTKSLVPLRQENGPPSVGPGKRAKKTTVPTGWELDR